MGYHNMYPYISKAAQRAGDAFIEERDYSESGTRIIHWNGETRMIYHDHMIMRRTKDGNLWLYGPRRVRSALYKGSSMRMNHVLHKLVGGGYTVVKHGHHWFSVWNKAKKKWHLVYDTGIFISLVAKEMGFIDFHDPKNVEVK